MAYSNYLIMACIWRDVTLSFCVCISVDQYARIFNAILVGIALAVAGCKVQGLVRNPLASTGYLGLRAEASVAVVLFLLI
ncbi:hypothetical protein CW304_02990 [Bacillus sp. UFRGS-B20]|nr:hypothetical protein CW304_02990 [Bacillus sp. UFRGS-B20]